MKARYDHDNIRYDTKKHRDQWVAAFNLQWPQDNDGRRYELHHIIPLALGGPNLLINFIPMSNHTKIHNMNRALDLIEKLYDEIIYHIKDPNSVQYSASHKQNNIKNSVESMLFRLPILKFDNMILSFFKLFIYINF